MELQNYLRIHGLDKTCQDLKLINKVHQDYPELILIKYDQIESDFSRIEVRQARGIILNREQDWEVISRSYDKFFNYLEPGAAEIDWNTARVYEKLDGSLAVLYWWDNQWQVQTSGSPDASGNVGDWGITFKELFWETWNNLKYELPLAPDVQMWPMCYSFELMTPKNRVIVPHKASKIALHGIRTLNPDLNYPEYDPIPRAKIYNWEFVRSFPLGSWKEITEASKILDPMEQEGYVVCDANFNRVKVKSPQYVAIAHLKDSVEHSQRRLVEIIRSNEGTEFLTYFPEFTDRFIELRDKYNQLIFNLALTYEDCKDIQSQKEFALKVKHYPGSSALFALRAGHVISIKQFFAEVNIDTLMKIIQPLEIKDVKN